MTKRASPSIKDASFEGRSAPWPWAVAEIGFIFLLFFLFAGSPPPDVGEAHYLAKAKHYWDPAWCRGDLFLESKDAHGVFYWTFGWVTRLVPLTAAAIVGRSITWLLLAWAWRRLSIALAPQRLMSVLTAGLLLLFLRWFHMAGEWIVGGVEAKGFSYVLVLLALESVVRGRWPPAVVLAGGATAFHVLVGGWTAVALGIAWLAIGRREIGLYRLGPALVAAALLAAIGVVPALGLSEGASPDIVREANRIYVFERLPHHLVFHRFGAVAIARNGVLLAAWLILAMYAWRSQQTALGRLHAVVAGAVAIALAGIAIDQGLVGYAGSQSLSRDQYQELAAPLLKYYWFRLSDALLPVGVAAAIGAWLVQRQSVAPQSASWGIIVAMLAVGANLGQVALDRWQRPLPGGFLQPRPTADLESDRWSLFGADEDERPPDSSAGTATTPATQQQQHQEKFSADEQFQYWLDVCRWAREKSPPDAMFLTPRRQQTFKWYAGRAEVASWKDVPQDAAAIVAWRGRLSEIFPRRSGDQDLAFHTDAQLLALARRYGVTHILIDRTRSPRPIYLDRVYPDEPLHNPAYAVYRVPQAPQPPPP